VPFACLFLFAILRELFTVFVVCNQFFMEMEFTGEQVVLGQTPHRVEAEHLVRYEYIKALAQDKVVLDVACGSGYGAALIGKTAKEVYGVDISPEAITHAEKNFSAPNTHFILGSGAELTFDDKFFDIVTSFETIEHLNSEDTKKYLAGIHRTLKDDGVFYVSTPNRRVVSPNSNVSLVSRWHIHEYVEPELVSVVEQAGFAVTEIYGQRILLKIFNIGVVRAIADFLGRVILKRRINLYWIPTLPGLVKYDYFHEPRVYFIVARKSK
jgi:ubiquinone/menaquinone biosynthesis C-methylase UbiE